MIRTYLAEARRIWREEGGVAFVEFAFVAPILLMLILGGLELANYALAHMRVNQIAMTVADNAGRVNTGIDEANVQEVFAGAGVIGEPLDFEAHGRIVLSSLQHNGRNGNDEGQMINWQRCWGDLEHNAAYGAEDDGRYDSSLEEGLGPQGKRITSAEGTAVMVAEVYYRYQPLIDTGFMIIDETISHESAFNVRGRENNDLTNSQNLQAMTCQVYANSSGNGVGSGSGGSSSGGSSSGGSSSGGSSSGGSSSGGSSSGGGNGNGNGNGNGSGSGSGNGGGNGNGGGGNGGGNGNGNGNGNGG